MDLSNVMEFEQAVAGWLMTIVVVVWVLAVVWEKR